MLLFCLTSIVMSCNIDDLPNFDNTYLPPYEGGIAILLINDTIHFGDFLEETIEDTSRYSIDANQSIVFSYLIEQDFESGDDFIEIEDIENVRFIESPIKVAGILPQDTTISIQRTLNFEFPSTDSETIDSIYYAGGTFNFELNTSFPGTVSYQFSTAAFENIASGDSILIDSALVKPTSRAVVIGEHVIPLMGYKTILESNGDENIFTVLLNADIALEQGQLLTGNEYINVDLLIASPDFEVVFGYFEKDTFNIDQTTVNLDFFADLGGEGIEFESPTIELNVDNSFGIPITVDFSEAYARYDNDETMKFSGEVLKEILAPDLKDFGSIASSILTIDSENSNLRQILAGSPNRIVLPLTGYTNQGTVNSNFLAKGSSIDINVKISIPLKLKMDEFEYESTAEVDDLDNLDGTTELSLLINTTNQLPFTGSLDLFMLDEDSVVLGSLLDQDIFTTPSDFDSNGKVASPSENTTEITLDQSLIDALIASSQIKTVVKVKSFDSENNNFVEVFADYELLIRVGLAGDVSLDLNSN